MASVRAVLLLFVAYSAIDLSRSAIYPYINQDSCSLKALDISQLNGDWYLVYAKHLVEKEVKLTFSKTSNNTVTVETREAGKLTKTQNLTQNAHLAGKLEELKSMGTYIIGLPWFFLDAGNNSLAIYHGHVNDADDTWAIYSRAKTLNEPDYTKSVQAFNCANLQNEKDKPLVYKAIL